MDLFDEEIIDNDVEILLVGLPRRNYERSEHFHNLSELEFFQRFRLTKQTVLRLLEQIEQNLEFPYNTNNAVSPLNQLLVTLRYYATGNHLLSISDFGGMRTSTVCRVLKRVTHSIAALAQQYIRMPVTPEEVMQVQRRFYEIARFLRGIGAIDRTHIKIQSPGGADAKAFRNRKGYFSINVQIVVDAKQKIMDVVSRWPGSTHYQTIFNASSLKMKFENGDYENLSLLRDSGYTLKPSMLTPHLNPVGLAQQRYNEAQIRSRNVVERTIGVWKRRFPVCAYGCRLKLENVLPVIVATSVLHKLALEMRDAEPLLGDNQLLHILDRHIDDGNIPNIQYNGGPELAGINILDVLTNQYFGQL